MAKPKSGSSSKKESKGGSKAAKERRKKLQAEREAANRERRANGELTPWEQRRATVRAARLIDPEVQRRKKAHEQRQAALLEADRKRKAAEEAAKEKAAREVEASINADRPAKKKAAKKRTSKRAASPVTVTRKPRPRSESQH